MEIPICCVCSCDIPDNVIYLVLSLQSSDLLFYGWTLQLKLTIVALSVLKQLKKINGFPLLIRGILFSVCNEDAISAF